MNSWFVRIHFCFFVYIFQFICVTIDSCILHEERKIKMNNNKEFLATEPIGKLLLRLAIPTLAAQMINMLYNIIDRIYIGHLPDVSSPGADRNRSDSAGHYIIHRFCQSVRYGRRTAFFYGRGAGEPGRARKILGNSFSMLLISGGILMILCYLSKRPLLYLFGASDITYPYANAYISLYLIGTLFVMISLGMNNFINAQGFGMTGMLTVSIGAVLNLILDPLFIFVLHMGVRGAALATIISQGISAIWVLHFLTGKKAILTLSLAYMKLDFRLVKEICALGLAGFIMAITNGSVQIVCNATLSRYGGDLYVGIMTVINSVREIITMPVTGLTSGAQPVMSFNYGARRHARVKSAIKFTTIVCILLFLFYVGITARLPTPLHSHVQQRTGFVSRRRTCDAFIFLWNLYDVACSLPDSPHLLHWEKQNKPYSSPCCERQSSLFH